MLALVLLLTAAPDSMYWQQRVAYEITASLAESTGVLTGRARIRYVNQSPDTLRSFAVHQYLNAFRPGSRWAAADSAEQRVRFQYLQDPDYAYERITASTVMGARQAPTYPFAPDSTIAQWSLPRPLAPGDSLVVEIDWQARPSTLPRRQGRHGRRFDFAQWYPKVVVYDKHGWQDHPLYPAGEFYGEFARYDVTLDLPADQVIGATGVPVEGDPGWEKAKVDRTLQIDYQRNWYAARRTPHPCTAGPGRKCVRFVADSVHHFAFSLNPDYRYEEGRYGDVVVRVLYLPQDSATWGHGIAVERTVAALRWLDGLFGTFPWPQITNVHRIESGGTEFPMLVMDGGASLGLIVHEVGHNYTMGILANNEWRAAWLDEGFTSFQSGWFFETQGQPSSYRRIEGNILFWDIERWSEPVAMVSEEYRDFITYNTMVYSKAQLFFEQLRYIVGDETMRRILRAYYARWRLKHVDEDAFRRVAEAVSGLDLHWLFAQWLHGTPLIDYRLKDVERQPLPGGRGRWRTTVTIERLGDGWMPVEIGDADEIYARSSGRPLIERVTFDTDHRPGRLTLDPRARAHDWNALNNREKRPVVGRGARLVFLDDPTTEAMRRNRIATGILPLGWYTDHGGRTGAIRVRENYLGRFAQNLALVSYGLGPDATNRLGVYLRLKNPVDRPLPRGNVSAAAWHVEG
ncbi:MAG: M1 family metallopeptidase, partial [Gemmatimonadales bacterium]